MKTNKEFRNEIFVNVATILSDMLKRNEYGSALVAVSSEDGVELFDDSCNAIRLRHELFEFIGTLRNVVKYSELCNEKSEL